ncbi:hypothetical protein C8R46DRAFT_832771, partial [Mycena filopes]
RLYLGKTEHHTVFEGEGVGGTLALALLRCEDNVTGPVTVVVDSQPAVNVTRALVSTPSHWIWDAWHAEAEAFAQKHPNAQVTVRWAPGHVGIIGNERADEEAKRAAQQQDSSPLGSIPLPLHGTLPWSKSAVRQRLNAELKRAVERQ